jgi:hypothetical protein
MHGAVAQDLLECHEECERVSGHKAALAATVKQLGDKVQHLQLFQNARTHQLSPERIAAIQHGSERYYVQWHCWQGRAKRVSPSSS